MSINLATIFETAMRDIADWDAYRRGQNYYKDGAVKKWDVKSEGSNSLIVKGTIEGTRDYETTFEYNLGEYEITNANCSCPYGYGCKHIAALGLHFSEMLRVYIDFGRRKVNNFDNQEISRDQIIHFAQKHYINDRVLVKEDTLNLSICPFNLRDDFTNKVSVQTGFGAKNEREDLVNELERLGLPIDVLGEQMIEKLLFLKHTAEEKSRIAIPLGFPTKPKVKKATLSEYYIRLDRDLTPYLCRKDSPYMITSIKNVLARTDISDAQRTLLESIRKGTFDPKKNEKRNPFDLVNQIKESGMIASLTYGYSYSYNDIKPVQFVVENSEKLKAKISYRSKTYYDDTKKQYFTFSMPGEYWKGLDNYLHAFQSAGDFVIHATNKIVTIYPMPSLLANIIAKVGSSYSYGDDYISKEIGAKEKYETELSGEEVWQYDEVIRLANEHLELIEKPKKYEIIRSTQALKVFVVNYDAIKQTLEIGASIDYGSLKQNVGESVFISMSGGTKHYAMRVDWGEDKTHRIDVSNSTIRIAKIDKKTEIGFYEEIRECSETVGFSKTLKCEFEGQSKIIKYLKSYWPALLNFANTHKYTVLFSKDKLQYEEARFRADFNIDLDATNDWLYFDLDCYCGPNKLTLPQIMRFIESGETILRKDDGTFVEISNRQEFERLVAMLKSFESREGGFEGRLYHAAELEYVATSSEHYTVARAKSFNDFMESAHNGKPVKPVPIHANFNKVLRPYQKEGVHWLHFLRSFRFAGILADDMGIGKTLQALTILSTMRCKEYPSIVICPKSLLFNWRNEVNTFAPELKTLVYEGDQVTRGALAKEMERYDLVVVSYATFKRDESKFVGKNIRFNYAVLDEAQFIKNHATKGAQIAKKINADYRLALTGTPMENNVSELWSVFDFLMPGFLGNYKDFHKRFHKPIMDNGDRAALEHLKRKIAPFMLRRTKGEVLKELPAKIEQEVICELGKAQNVLYQQILAKVRGEVFAAVNQKGFKSAQIHILAGLMKLRQVCNHPALLLDDKKDDWKKHQSAKLDLAKELVDEAVKGGHKVLIFSQFTSMLDILGKAFDESKHSYVYLSGKTRDRESLVKQFNEDPRISIFLISLKAGGTGLNLTSADTVIIFDPWWNPSVEAQAADRAHRIGQKKIVNVYRLLTKGTIEEKIQALKKKKKSLSDALVDSSRDMFSKLTWDDIKGLFD